MNYACSTSFNSTHLHFNSRIFLRKFTSSSLFLKDHSSNRKSKQLIDKQDGNDRITASMNALTQIEKALGVVCLFDSDL